MFRSPQDSGKATSLDSLHRPRTVRRGLRGKGAGVDSFRRDVRTVVVALVVSLLVAGGPALAQQLGRATGTAQPRCKPGAVLAFADVDTSQLTSVYSMHGV